MNDRKQLPPFNREALPAMIANIPIGGALALNKAWNWRTPDVTGPEVISEGETSMVITRKSYGTYAIEIARTPDVAALALARAWFDFNGK